MATDSGVTRSLILLGLVILGGCGQDVAMPTSEATLLAVFQQHPFATPSGPARFLVPGYPVKSDPLGKVPPGAYAFAGIHEIRKTQAGRRAVVLLRIHGRLVRYTVDLVNGQGRWLLARPGSAVPLVLARSLAHARPLARSSTTTRWYPPGNGPVIVIGPQRIMVGGEVVTTLAQRKKAREVSGRYLIQPLLRSLKKEAARYPGSSTVEIAAWQRTDYQLLHDVLYTAMQSGRKEINLVVQRADSSLGALALYSPRYVTRPSCEGHEWAVLNLMVQVTNKGFIVRTQDNALVPLRDNRHDHLALTRALTRLKAEYPEETVVMISPGHDLEHQVLIRTMDAVRETAAHRPLFPHILLVSSSRL